MSRESAIRAHATRLARFKKQLSKMRMSGKTSHFKKRWAQGQEGYNGKCETACGCQAWFEFRKPDFIRQRMDRGGPLWAKPTTHGAVGHWALVNCLNCLNLRPKKKGSRIES